MRTLFASLAEHPLALLRAIAELRGVELNTNVRGDAAEHLAAALADDERAAQALSGCSDEARSAFVALYKAGSRMKYPVFARLYGDIRPVGPGKLEREEVWRQPTSPAEELWYRGLVFRVFADLGDGPLEYVYIPEDMPLPRLPAAVQPRQTPAPSVSEQPPRVYQALNTLAVDAVAVLASLRDRPAPVERSGALAPEAAERLRAQLIGKDPTRLAFLVALLQARGWIGEDRGQLVVDHERTGAWLRAAAWSQMSTLFSGWLETTEWNELRQTPGLIAEGDWHNDPLLARRTLLDALKELDPKAWFRIDDLVFRIKATNPDFQRPDGAYGGWYIKEEDTGRYLSGFESWDRVEGRLLRFLLEGPLFWLGAVALGEWAVGEPLAIRLASFGVAWLNNRLPSSLPRPARLGVDESFVVSAPLFVPLLDRFRLLRITEALPLEPGETGRNAERLAGTRHRITRASLARARDAGVKPEAALDFLRRASGNAIPSGVATAISRFGELGGAVRLTRGAVLRVGDAAALATLRADPQIAPLLGELLSAQAVIVRDSNIARLQALLEEGGYKVTLE